MSYSGQTQRCRLRCNADVSAIALATADPSIHPHFKEHFADLIGNSDRLSPSEVCAK
jgi:hypothetical protein